MPNINQTLKATYTPDDIKALIVADLKGRGFVVDLSDVKETDDGVAVEFQGFEICKDMPTTKPATFRDANRPI